MATDIQYTACHSRRESRHSIKKSSRKDSCLDSFRMTKDTENMDVEIQYSVCLNRRDLNIVLERNALRFVFGFFQNDKKYRKIWMYKFNTPFVFTTGI